MENKKVDDLYLLWKQKPKHIQNKTYKNYIHVYETFIQPKIGSYSICDVSRTTIMLLYEKIVQLDELKIGSIRTVNTIVRQIFFCGIEEGYISENPTDYTFRGFMQKYGRFPNDKDVLSKTQQKIFEDFLEKNKTYDRWRAVFLTILYTGIMTEEISTLKWQQINLDKGEIILYKGKEGQRTIPLVPSLKKVLVKLKTANKGKEDDFVFLNRDGNPQQRMTLNKGLQRILIKLNKERLKNHELPLPVFTYQSLRHTFVERLLDANVDKGVICNVLGCANSNILFCPNVSKDKISQEFIKFNRFCRDNI